MAVIGNAPFQGLVSGGNILDASIEGVDLSTSAIAARLGYTPVDPGAAVFSANPTINSGTANTVAFLNGSKVVSGSSNLTFNGTTLTVADITDSSLTSGRVVYAGTGGNLTDSAGLTFDGNALTLGGSAPFLRANMSGTQSTRLGIQNSTTNGNTRFFLYPNGTGNISAINGWNNSDPNAANYQSFDLAVIGTQDVRLSSGASGSAAYLPLTFWNGGSERARIDSNGNLSINTTGFGSPGLSVTNSQNISFVESTSGQSIATVFRQANSADLVLGSGVRYSATANGFASSFASAWARTAINVGYGAIRFFTAAEATVAVGTDTTLTERMRITAAGNILIGSTTEVGVRLNVEGRARFVASFVNAYTPEGLFNSNATPVFVVTPSNANLRFGYQDDGGGQYNPAIGFAAPIVSGFSANGTNQVNYSNRLYATTDGALAISTGTGGSSTERLRISNAGNMSIGTTGGGYRLNVNTSTGSGIQIVTAGATTNSPSQDWFDSSFGTEATLATLNGAVQFGTYTNHPLVLATNNAERLRITTAGSLAFANTNTYGIIRRTSVNGSNGIRIQANAADSIDDSNAGASIMLGGGIIGDTYEGNIDITAYGSIVDSNRNQIRFINRSGTNATQERMRIDHVGRVLIGQTSATANGGLLQIGQVPNTTSSSIGFNNGDNAVISARYSLVFQANNDGNISGRDITFRQGGKGYGDGSFLMRVSAAGVAISNTSRVYSGGGEYAFLGNVSKSEYTHEYIHVKTNLSMYSYKMTMFKVTGYHAYSNYAESYLGCYTYGEFPTNTMAGAYPFGVTLSNQGGIQAANNMYYSSDGYLCLLLYWPSLYTGLAVQYFATGGTHGNVSEVGILSFLSNNSTAKAY